MARRTAFVLIYYQFGGGGREQKYDFVIYSKIILLDIFFRLIEKNYKMIQLCLPMYDSIIKLEVYPN